MRAMANKNQVALEAAKAKGGKRWAKLLERVPRTTIAGQLRGNVPTLAHAHDYEDCLRLKTRDWFVEASP